MLSFAAVLLAGLSVVGQENDAIERGTARFEPTAAEATVPETFRLEAATFDYVRTPLPGAPAVSKVTFPSPVVTPDAANNTVHAEYFRPSQPGPRPAVVVLHILGADFALSRYLASRLADRGVAALFVKLPYYGERRPTDASRFLSADMDRSMRSMRQGVLDVRRAIAWLGSRPEIDPNRLGVTGISLGGIISALAAEVEPRIGKVGILLGGGGLADILWNMPEPEARRYQKLWLESGRTFGDLEALTHPVDPLSYADRLASKKVLMIAGRVDEVVPPRAAEGLWAAAGRPEIIWYDCGHYSAVAYLLPAMRRTVSFFEND